MSAEARSELTSAPLPLEEEAVETTKWNADSHAARPGSIAAGEAGRRDSHCSQQQQVAQDEHLRSPMSRPIAPPDSPYLLISKSSAHFPRRSVDQPATPVHPTRSALRRSRTTSSRSAAARGLTPIRTSRNRPRFWALLPLVALIDMLMEGVLAWRILEHVQQEYESAPHRRADHKGSGEEWMEDREAALVFALMGMAVLRSIVIAVVGIANKTDQLGLVVATVCALSTLVTISIFNLLFQSGQLFQSSPWTASMPLLHTQELPSHLHFPLPSAPSLAILNTTSLLFTIFEYVLYVLVVGIRVPPTGITRGRMEDMRRWKRGMREQHASASAGGAGGGQDFFAAPEEEISNTQEVQRTPKVTARDAGGQREASASRGILHSPVSPLKARSYGATEYAEPLSLPEPAMATFKPASSSSPQQNKTFDASNLLELQLSGAGGTRSDAARLSRRSSAAEDLHGEATDDAEEDGNEQDAEEDDLDLDEEERDNDEDEDDDSEDDAPDPDEIIDIPPLPTSLSRDASRFRLAMAMADSDTRRSSVRSASGSGSGSGSGGGSGFPVDLDEDEGEGADEEALREAEEDRVWEGLPTHQDETPKRRTYRSSFNTPSTSTAPASVASSELPSAAPSTSTSTSTSARSTRTATPERGTAGSSGSKLQASGKSPGLFRSGSQKLRRALSGGGGSGGGGGGSSGGDSGSGSGTGGQKLRFFGSRGGGAGGK